MNKKLLIIGGKSYQDTDNPRIGGTTILMDNYLDYCSSHHVPYEFISTNRYYGKLSGIRNMMSMIFLFFKHIGHCDVIMVNISSKSGFMIMLPYFVFWSKILRKEVVIRMFAGNIHKFIESKKYLKPFIFRCLKQTKVSFFETKEIIQYFKDNGYDANWFPNIREPNADHVGQNYDKRFVFVSQIKESKGVDYLLRLSNVLPQEYTIDIYGPIMEAKYSEEYFKKFRAEYKGVIKSKDVIKTLSEYNILILPTYWIGEGYPGIIIEAQSIGMPVISTLWGAIPELIEDNVNGILVPIKDEQALLNAILRITQSEYDKFSKETDIVFNARFNSDSVNKRVTDLMLN